MNLRKPKIYLAMACAGALALGAAPAAFANPLDANNSGSTTVQVTTDSHLSADVPLIFGVKASIDGGALEATSNSYGITNNSYFDIYVTKVQAEAQGNWAYSATPFAAAGTAATTGKVGDINLMLQPAGGSLTTLDGTSQKVSWKIDPATTSAGTSKQIAVTGSTSTLTKVVGSTPEAAAKITYTISPTA